MTFSRHHILTLLCVFLSCHCSVTAADNVLKERYTAEHPLVFEDAWEKKPYCFINTKGEPAGFDIEMTREVMRRLGLPLVIRLADQDSVYSDMAARRAALTFAVKTSDYARYGRFGSITITQAETSLMVPRRDSVSHVTIDELRRMKLSVRNGSLSHNLLVQSGMPDSLLTVENHMTMAILDMVGEDGGCALWNTVMLKWLIRKYDIRDYVLVPTDIPSAEYRYMSNDTQLLHAIDSVCLVMQQEGRIDKMKNRWMYPDKEPQNYLYLYLLLTLLGVGVVLTAIVLLMKYYRIYYSHNTLDDVNVQMELILSSNDVKVWVYDIIADTYAWMNADGRVEREYSAFEFSRFFAGQDFQTIHGEVMKLKKKPGVIVTKHFGNIDVSMQAITDDYGKVYMVCGVQREALPAPASPVPSVPSRSPVIGRVLRQKPQAHTEPSSTCLSKSKEAPLALQESGRTPLPSSLSSDASETGVKGKADAPSSADRQRLVELKNLAEEILRKSHALRTFLLTVLLTAASATWCQAAPLGIRYTKKHPLVIVTDWNFAPYSFRNDNSQQDGFLVELVEQIFNQIHVPYEIRMVDWRQAKSMIYSGEAQLMVDVRKPDDLYGSKYGEAVVADYPLCVARLKTTPAMGSIETLDEKDTIYVNYGDYALHYIVTMNAKPIVLPCPPYDALSDILSGKVKYYVWSKEAMKRQISDYAMQDMIEVDEVDIIGGQFRFMSNDAQLLSEIDAQFERLQSLGRYTPLVDKWLSDEGKYDEGTTTLDVIAIVAMLLLFVGSIIALVFIMRGGNTGNLKREFRAIAHMAITLTGCNVLAINVRRMWVYNVSGDFLPRKGLSMADYEALIHPDDIMTEYEARRRVDDGERNMPVVTFRMKKYGDTQDEWHQVSVHAYIKSRNGKHPAYVYLALKVEDDNIQPAGNDGAGAGSTAPSATQLAANPDTATLRQLLEDIVRQIDKML